MDDLEVTAVTTSIPQDVPKIEVFSSVMTLQIKVADLTEDTLGRIFKVYRLST